MNSSNVKVIDRPVCLCVTKKVPVHLPDMNAGSPSVSIL